MGRSRAERREPVGARVAQVFRQGLWLLIPAISLGFFAFVPAVHVAAKARTRGWVVAAAAVSVATAGQWTAMANDAEGPGAGFLLMGTVSAGLVTGALGRETVFGSTKKKLDPAVEAVLDDRERRQQAREIAANDPEMALELGIGRPELRRKYKDGGLIDLNNAPARSITRVLGWPSALAAEFVADRDARDGYESVTEVGAMSSLDPTRLEENSDRIVVLPYQGA